MKTRTIIIMLLAAVVCGLTVRLIHSTATPPEPTIQRDTIVIRDTVRPPIPEPVVITVVRYDTVRPQTKPVEKVTPVSATVIIPEDTIARNSAVIPITRNTYKTEEYTAVVEGYRPQLVSMELYRKTTTVTNKITKTRSPRWVLSAGPGIGYGPNGVQPYVGVSVGFVLWAK